MSKVRIYLFGTRLCLSTHLCRREPSKKYLSRSTFSQSPLVKATKVQVGDQCLRKCAFEPTTLCDAFFVE